MEEPNPSIEAKKVSLQHLYAAINRNDISAVAAELDPHIEWTEPLEYPDGGTYHGSAAVQAHLEKQRGRWAEGSCEPERFIPAGDKIIVVSKVRVRMKNSNEWIEGEIADVFTFLNGKAIGYRHFQEIQFALEWAGVNAADSN